ncbi:MAG: hypothetical protein QW524_01860 [Candidatus Woesearchaeota archaeon]
MTDFYEKPEEKKATSNSNKIRVSIDLEKLINYYGGIIFDGETFLTKPKNHKDFYIYIEEPKREKFLEDSEEIIGLVQAIDKQDEKPILTIYYLNSSEKIGKVLSIEIYTKQFDILKKSTPINKFIRSMYDADYQLGKILENYLLTTEPKIEEEFLILREDENETYEVTERIYKYLPCKYDLYEFNVKKITNAEGRI